MSLIVLVLFPSAYLSLGFWVGGLESVSILRKVRYSSRFLVILGFYVEMKVILFIVIFCSRRVGTYISLFIFISGFGISILVRV